MSYKIQLVEEKGPLIQLEPSKSSIKDKYQITLSYVKKYKPKGKSISFQQQKQ